MQKVRDPARKFTLTFKKRPDGSIFIVGSPPIKFFISQNICMSNEFLLEPLTLTRFVKSFLINLFHLNHWKLLRFLVWRCHAFEYTEGEVILWRQFKPFRWCQRTFISLSKRLKS